MKLRNILDETENAVETINIKLDPAEERTCELKDGSLEIIQSEEYKEKENEKEWRKPMWMWTQLSAIYNLLQSQKKKRGRKGKKVYLKKIMAENLQT